MSRTKFKRKAREAKFFQRASQSEQHFYEQLDRKMKQIDKAASQHRFDELFTKLAQTKE